ncbi:MAG TPA: chemotaxis-specific protein-glutamate methyltransferase CheB [bacterium]|nr:chemotaxis-specific protein-glutamate methyltransferase CheB [bacterium]
MNRGKIRVLISDDSAVVREILKDMISGEPDLEIAGEAMNGKQAVELAESERPDIITMDVLMPVMNGLEAVEQIMAYTPTPILVFSSALDDKEMDVAFQAIARGALDVLEKPKVPSGDQYERIRRDFLDKLRMLSRIHVIPHLRGKRKKNRYGAPEPEATPPPRRAEPAAAHESRPAPALSQRAPEPRPGGMDQAAPEPEPFDKEVEIPESSLVQTPPRGAVRRKMVAIGSSTGGPKALVQIFRRIPAGFPLPVLTVQHIAPSFAPGLVSWLNRESQLSIVLARDRTRPEPGTVYISPTGVHMVVDKGMIRLTETPPVNSCRPSVDVLFITVAESFGEYAVAVLLTGMGRDGAEGMKAIKDRKGRTMIQDQATSVIFGMPKAALELGAADEVVPLSRIPEAIVRALR